MIEPLVWQRKMSAVENPRRLWPLLDTNEQAAAVSIKNAARRVRYVAAHGYLRNLLSETVDEAPQKLRILKNEYGKPFLADYPKIAFNLSHSANFLIIAIGRDCRLGIDIEVCKPRANFPALVQKCFGDIEAAWWNSLPESEKIREFYRFWTRKEAFVKAVGRGIALGLNRCIVNPEHPTRWLSVPESCGAASDWHILDINLGREVCCALSADKAIAGIKLIIS
ncbi:MAG: 4'-phosphopantetheinyl transferase family protein [Gammaproteobacteria bacterium]